jgi:hypothetical protein
MQMMTRENIRCDDSSKHVRVTMVIIFHALPLCHLRKPFQIVVQQNSSYQIEEGVISVTALVQFQPGLMMHQQGIVSLANKDTGEKKWNLINLFHSLQ